MRKTLLLAAGLVALLVPAAAQAFTPNDPLLPRQWYAPQDKAFDAFNVLPLLPSVRVAVIDSGVDVTHPDLKGHLLAARSFVGGSPSDDQGHGTFVAGEIAASVDDGRGIAGLAPAANLLVAKVVRPDGSVSTRAEARAIRWAVRMRAKVINISLGGLRDPQDPFFTGYSKVEQQAVDDAVAAGVLVVAAVGNNKYAPARPWRYASYPSALPHVLGVGSYGHSGDVSTFSNQDPIFVDLVAPGEDMFSLFPRTLTSKNTNCDEQGYSSCGPKDYHHAAGTSFSAPQAAAAAATLFSLDPTLTSDQVSWLLERSATPATPANGCIDCPPGRNALSGWGKLNIAAAIRALRAGQAPVPDRFEPNDDIQIGKAIHASKVRFRATVDYWDDANDVYRIKLRRGQRISVIARPSSNLALSVVLWKPALESLAQANAKFRAQRAANGPGAVDRFKYRAPKAGWYSLQVAAARTGFGAYKLRILRSR
ncbi:MAG TPA: S8 family serine peptidase [Gaiellaceae bacterium]